MTLETVSGAFILFLIILIPLVLCFVGLVWGSLRYWKESRKDGYFVMTLAPNPNVTHEFLDTDQEIEEG